MLIFQENTRLPVVQVSMKDLPLATLLEVLESHQFLQLPRLSSQEIFDHLCPPESSKTRKRLCVILISKSETDPKEERKREALRSFLAEHKFNPERVRFTYIQKQKQSSFVGQLAAQQTQPDENLVIIWRKDEENISYQWLQRYFKDSQFFLSSLLSSLLSNFRFLLRRYSCLVSYIQLSHPFFNFFLSFLLV